MFENLLLQNKSRKICLKNLKLLLNKSTVVSQFSEKKQNIGRCEVGKNLKKSVIAESG